jgi:hypothetical protein
MAAYSIRPARPDELRAVQEIERRAATRLAGVELAAAADLPIQPIEALRADCDRGQLLVVTDDDDHPVGFALFALHEASYSAQRCDEGANAAPRRPRNRTATGLARELSGFGDQLRGPHVAVVDEDDVPCGIVRGWHVYPLLRHGRATASSVRLP